MRKQKRQTSKVLTWLIITIYLSLLLLSIPLRILFNLDIGYVFDYLQPLVLMIIGSYFFKAGAENVSSIMKAKLTSTEVPIEDSKNAGGGEINE